MSYSELTHQHKNPMPIVSTDPLVLHQQASSLIRAGSEIFLIGDVEAAQVFFDTSHALLLTLPQGKAPEIGMRVSENMILPRLHSATANPIATPQKQHPPSHTWVKYPPDIYECDASPRLLMSPVSPNVTGCPFGPGTTDCLPLLLEMAVVHNKGLIFHSKEQSREAFPMYDFVSKTSQWMFPRLETWTPYNEIAITAATLAMRSCNNMGVLYFTSHNFDQAECYFMVAVRFAKQLVDYSSDFALEYATTLSNLCRVQWRTISASDQLFQNLETVLSVRRSVLGNEHPDTAASVFNVAAAMYARQDRKSASFQLLQYLAIASRANITTKTPYQQRNLDAFPALTLLLLIRNEHKDTQLAKDLVQGLRTLQEKRQGGSCTSPEVASLLNYIGTMLFHQEDFEHALVFFLEELRLEDHAASNSMGAIDERSPSVVSVTCNNIGRITQELERFEEAVHFYKRSLEDWYGENLDLLRFDVTAQIASTQRKFTDCKDQSAAVNLYSTVWYNLGLILDKLRKYDEAMVAFKMALSLREAMVGQNHPDIACLLYNIGVLQLENKRLDDASVSLLKAISIRRCGVAGQLSDLYLVKTLEKLSKLHQKEGSLPKALEALQQVALLQQDTDELEAESKTEAIGLTSASIAELYLSLNKLDEAAACAVTSVRKFQLVLQSARYPPGSSSRSQQSRKKTVLVEQLVSSLLLLGSVHHEMSEPILAMQRFADAKQVAHMFSQEWTGEEIRPASLNAICEVTALLCTSNAAPQA